MKNIDELMFRKEHFPAIVHPSGIIGAILPPYHPSMQETGIDVDLTISLANNALEETIQDLIDLKLNKKSKSAEYELKQIERKGKKIGNVKEYQEYKIIEPFPLFTSGLCVGKDVICPNIPLSDGMIAIMSHLKQDCGFSVPNNIIISPELMKEYDITKTRTLDDEGISEFKSPYGWYFHNVLPARAIFYKNLVIALDNAIVKRKYACD